MSQADNLPENCCIFSVFEIVTELIAIEFCASSVMNQFIHSTFSNNCFCVFVDFSHWNTLARWQKLIIVAKEGLQIFSWQISLYTELKQVEFFYCKLPGFKGNEY